MTHLNQGKSNANNFSLTKQESLNQQQKINPANLAIQQPPNKALVSQAIAGFVAAAISTGILHPFDLIKTRLQVNEVKSLGTIAVFRNVVKFEGIRSGLYRGMSANLAGGTTSWALYFLLYQDFKDRKRSGSQALNPSQHLIAAAQAGALTSLVTNPLWVVKTQICASKASDLHAFRDGLIKTYKFEGIPGLYKGLLPGLFGVSHGAIQFMIYEELKRISGPDTHPLGYVVMAASSKVVAAVCTYPYQVVRTRLQNEKLHQKHRVYRGVWQTICKIYGNESISGFYKGLTPNVIRVLPGTCITFGVYEAVVKYFNNNN